MYLKCDVYDRMISKINFNELRLVGLTCMIFLIGYTAREKKKGLVELNAMHQCRLSVLAPCSN